MSDQLSLSRRYNLHAGTTRTPEPYMGYVAGRPVWSVQQGFLMAENTLMGVAAPRDTYVYSAEKHLEEHRIPQCEYTRRANICNDRLAIDDIDSDHIRQAKFPEHHGTDIRCTAARAKVSELYDFLWLINYHRLFQNVPDTAAALGTAMCRRNPAEVVELLYVSTSSPPHSANAAMGHLKETPLLPQKQFESWSNLAATAARAALQDVFLPSYAFPDTLVFTDLAEVTHNDRFSIEGTDANVLVMNLRQPHESLMATLVEFSCVPSAVRVIIAAGSAERYDQIPVHPEPPPTPKYVANFEHRLIPYLRENKNVQFVYITTPSPVSSSFIVPHVFVKLDFWDFRDAFAVVIPGKREIVTFEWSCGKLFWWKNSSSARTQKIHQFVVLPGLLCMEMEISIP